MRPRLLWQLVLVCLMVGVMAAVYLFGGGGCVRYRARGPIRLQPDVSFLQEETDRIRAGSHYWDVVGSRFRLADEMQPGLIAYELPIRRNGDPEDAAERGGWYSCATGEITLYTGTWMSLPTFGEDCVVAHELGHAVGLGHVANCKAVMAACSGGEVVSKTITADDLEEFYRVNGR